jgi:hypothetical protein
MKSLGGLFPNELWQVRAIAYMADKTEPAQIV